MASQGRFSSTTHSDSILALLAMIGAPPGLEGTFTFPPQVRRFMKPAQPHPQLPGWRLSRLHEPLPLLQLCSPSESHSYRRVGEGGRNTNGGGRCGSICFGLRCECLLGHLLVLNDAGYIAPLSLQTLSQKPIKRGVKTCQTTFFVPLVWDVNNLEPTFLLNWNKHMRCFN